MIKWLSVPQYMKLSGASRDVVNELVRTGELTSVKVGNAVKIKIEEAPIELLLEEIKELKTENIYIKECVTALCAQFNTNV
jgi:hypothetical protein